MNTATVSDDTVEIKLHGFDKIWAFKSRLNIPRQSIRKVYLRPKDLRPPWLRAPGTYLPWVIAAGTYRGSGRKEFWSSHFRENCMVFDLEGFKYTRVVVDIDNARELVRQLSR